MSALLEVVASLSPQRRALFASNNRLSFSQERLWFLQQLNPASPAYNISAAIRLTGKLDLDAIHRAINAIVARHGSLRTTFPTVDGKPIQFVAPQQSISICVEDLSKAPGHDTERAVLRMANAEAQRPFDLGEGPLLRMKLAKLADEDHVLIVSMHHIISDGWSINVLMSEFVEAYAAFSAGRNWLPPELPIQYVDFARWQREWLQGDLLNRQLDYWKQHLSGAPATLELATDRPRPAVQTFEGTSEIAKLPDTLVTQLNQFSRNSGTTLFMTMFAAFNALLYRYTRQPDIVVGTPIAGRNRPEVEGLIGFFLNTLPIRTTLSADMTFRELLQQVKEASLGAFAHQDLPFEKLVDEIESHRDLSRSPIFQVMFVLQTGLAQEVPLSKLRIKLMDLEQTTAKFDLVMVVSDPDKGLLELKYRTGLFNRETILRMLGHYTTLLETAVANPDQKLGLLPLLHPEERAQLNAWNETQVEYPGTQSLVQLIEAQVERTPNAQAVAFEGEQLTYTELNRRANQLARHIQIFGARLDQPVAVYMERSVEMVVALLAVLKAGSAYLPLDPSYPDERLAFMLEDGHVKVLLTQEKFLDALPAYGAHIVSVDGQRQELELESDELLESDISPDNLAYVIYTSGSTGVPKGVMNSHRGICNRLQWMQQHYGLTPADRVLQKTTFGFDVSVWEFFWPLMTGACLIVAKPGGQQDSAYLTELIARERVTTLHFVPSMLGVFLQDRSLHRCTSLKRVICSGEALSVELQKRFFERLGAELHNLYGPTEAAVDVTYWACRRDGADRTVPIGRAIANIRIHVLDEQLEQTPVGVPGELHIAGVGLARGYLNRPALTAEKFIPDPYSAEPGGRLYKTGDLARYLPDGNVEYLGRIDHQVKIRGFRIELGEIEAALCAHPNVEETAVTALQGAEGDKRLVAYVVPAGGHTLETKELQNELRGRLPEYMIPSAFVLLDKLPLTSSGKVDRKALPAPQSNGAGHAKEYEAPRTKLEQMLAHMWSETLDVQRVGIHDNFFELGGESIKGAILINALQEKLGEIIFVVAIFDAPTIAELAQYLTDQYPEAVARVCGENLEVQKTPTGNEHERVDEEMVRQVKALIKPLGTRSQSEAQKNPPAVFVLSPPRSGSTLLRVMLGGHRSLFAPPELELLSFNTLAERTEVFKGRDKFWLEGTVRGVMEAKGCDAQQATDLLDEYERSGMTTKECYARMQDWIGEHILIDKTPSYALDLEILKRAEEDFHLPKYIHLLRHPYGMIRSFEEAKLDQIFFRYEHGRSRRQIAEIIWLISEQNILEFLESVDPARWHQVRFEELVSEPRRVMEGICDFLELDFQEEMLQPYKDKQKRMTDGVHSVSHMLGDIKFHEHQQIDANVAARWKQSYDEEFIGAPAAELAVKLGYADLKLEKKVSQTTVAAPRTQSTGGAQITPRDTRSPVRLSFAQQRMWFLDQFEPNSSSYIWSAAIRLNGTLDVEALEETINAILQRHEVLRTSFATFDGQPMQVIESWTPYTIPVIDLTSLDAEEREAKARQLVNEEAERAFDLTETPMLRVSLYRLADREHIALFTMPHIASDGWSIGILLHEVVSLYGAFSAGQTSPLPDLAIQYADYAVWQRQWLQGQVLQDQVDFWKAKLSGELPVLSLPIDRPRLQSQTYRGVTKNFSLPAQLSKQLKQLGHSEGATMFMTLLAAFNLLLHRYSGQKDIIVGSPIANRNRPETEPLIGFFVNTLALRTDLTGNPTFIQLLNRVKEMTLGAYKHQDLPFEKLVHELQQERSLSQSALFNVMFVLQNTPMREVTLPGLEVTPFDLENRTSIFDLTLNIRESSSGLEGALEYNSDLFEEQTIERMMGNFAVLLEAIANDPQQPIAGISILTPAEERRLLRDWNQTREDYPQDLCIHDLIAQQAEATPGAIAAVCNGRELSYTELDKRANQLANYLRSCGVGPEMIVGICMEKSLELMVSMLGVLKAGGAYVPLDPSYPAERMSFVLSDAQISVLLTQQHLHDLLPTGSVQIIHVDTAWDEIGTRSEDQLESTVLPDNPAYVIYTSGSTGTPKGVVISHRSLVSHAWACRRMYNLQSSDRLLQVASISFDVAVEEIYPTLLAGGAVVFRGDGVYWSGEGMLEAIREDRISVLNVSATHWNELVNELTTLDELVPSCLRLLVTGVEKISHEQIMMWRKVGGDRVVFDNTYGLTETTVGATVYKMAGQDDRGNSAQVPIGKPLANTAVYLLDENFEPVPVGATGEIYIAGERLARGYLNRAELTAERFLPNPYSEQPGQRMYKTGDLAKYLPDGNLEFCGRVDQQVKIRGYRIELEEIEAVLTGHEGVREAVVIARKDKPGYDRLVAYFTVQTLSEVTVSRIKNYIKQKLPPYMVPSAFVRLDAFPLTSNGKLDLQNLPAPDASRQEVDETFYPPGTKVETLIADIWADLIGLERVSVYDNFFDLGGHSLLATQFISRARRVFGIHLPLRLLFECPTVSSLAERIEGLLKSGVDFQAGDLPLEPNDPVQSYPGTRSGMSNTNSPIIPLKKDGANPPLYCIHPAGGHIIAYRHLAKSLGMDQPVYGLQSPALDATVVEAASIEEIAAYYAAALQFHRADQAFWLLGWSMGGVIAVSVAKQLELQGREVAFVGLLDARMFSGGSGVIADGAENFVLSLQSTLGDAALDPAEERTMRRALGALSNEARLQQVLVWAKQRHLLPDDMSLEMFRHQVDLYESHARMLNAHAAPVIKSPLHVWWARQSCVEGASLTDWSKHTEAGIYEEILDGDHYTFLRPPNSEKLGARLKERLEMIRTSRTQAWSGASALSSNGDGKVYDASSGVISQVSH